MANLSPSDVQNPPALTQLHVGLSPNFSGASPLEVRRPVLTPSLAEQRLPATSLSSVSRFQVNTLQNLLYTLQNDFLEVIPPSVDAP